MEMHEKFGKFLKQKRIEKKIKVREIQERARVSDSQIFNLENNRNGPSLRTADNILRAINEPWEAFIQFSKAE